MKPGDAVGVHSSLAGFGRVEGGADAVIDAILETIGPEGTAVFPAYSNNRELLELTPDEQAQGLCFKHRILPYDPLHEGCWTGRIADTFWRRPGAVRGTSPTQSLAALGRHKQRFLAERWEALLDLDGFILLLGVGLGCCSAMHIAERQLVKFPERILRRITPPAELRERMEREHCHFYFGPYPAMALMEGPCREAGIFKEGMIGAAPVKLFRLRAAVDAYARALQEDPDRFYA